MVLTLIGVLIPMLMADPSKMIRTDGTRVSTPRQPSWKTEIAGLFIALRDDPAIVMLFPMFLASNWFYTWRMFPYFSCLDIPKLTCIHRIQQLQRCYLQHPCTFSQQRRLLGFPNHRFRVNRSPSRSSHIEPSHSCLQWMDSSILDGLRCTHLGLLLSTVCPSTPYS